MPRMNKGLFAGASVCALLIAAPMALGHFAERAVERSLAVAGIAHSGPVAVSPFSGVVSVAGVTMGDGAVTIGSVRWQGAPLGLVSPAYAQAGGFTLENIRTEFKQGSITIPKVVVEGASFGKDDWAKIFAFDAGMPARLKGMNAKLIMVPEIRVQFSIDAQNKTDYTMKDIMADGLVAGRFGKVSVGNTVFSTTAPGMNQEGVVKKTEMTGFDMAQVARVWFETAAPGEKSLPLYESYLMEGMTSTATGATALDMDFGKAAGRSIRMRPIKGKSLAVVVDELIKAGAAKKAAGDGAKKPDDIEALRGILRPMIDLIEGFEDDGASGEGLRMVVGAKTDKPVSIGIGKFAGSYGGGSVPSGFLLADISVKAPDVNARLAHVGVAGFSYLPTMRGLAEALEKGDTDFKSIDPRRLMPKLGEFTIKGLDIDAADPNSPPGVKAERILLKLGEFLLAGKNEINGIPTDIRLGLTNLAFKLPENSSDANLKMIRALGYPTLDMSAKIAMNWNEPAREIQISEVSLGGVNMGTVRLNGSLGNIGRDLFEADPALMQVALMGATAKTLSLKVENTGLADKLLAMQARQQGRKPEDLRKEMGTLAALGIPALLGPSDDAKAISGAVSRFLAKPKNLAIDVKAKNAGGIGIPDIVTVADPQAAMGLVSVKASATD